MSRVSFKPHSPQSFSHHTCKLFRLALLLLNFHEYLVPHNSCPQPHLQFIFSAARCTHMVWEMAGGKVANCQPVAALRALCSDSLMLPVYLLRDCVVEPWTYATANLCNNVAFSVSCRFSVLLNSMYIMFLMRLWTHKFASISYCIFGEHLDVMEVNML